MHHLEQPALKAASRCITQLLRLLRRVRVQMGLTPADDASLGAGGLPTSRNKRSRSALRPDSEGRLSEK